MTVLLQMLYEWIHIDSDNLCKKLTRIIFLLRSLKYNVPFAYLRSAYYIIFHSIISYGLLIWGHSTGTYINKVFLLQKKAIRIIMNVGIKEHCKPLCVQSKIMTVTSLYILQLLLFLKNNVYSIECANNRHCYNTRRNELFYVPIYRLSKTMNNHFAMALKVGNRMPVHIFQLNNMNFKKGCL